MKKKLGDMTIRELLKEQERICKFTKCKDCPFEDCCVTFNVDLEEEVEVNG